MAPERNLSRRVTPGWPSSDRGRIRVDRYDLSRVVLAAVLSTLVIGSAAAASGAPPVSAAEAPVSFPFDVGDLPAGETLVLEFQASVPAAPVPAGVEAVSNQATVTATGVSAIPTDDPDTVAAGDPTVTPIAAAPDLAVVKTVVDVLDDAGVSTGQVLVARPGNTVIYQLAWQNKAAATQIAGAVALTDVVPVDSQFDAAASTAGWSCADGAPAGTSCTFDLGSVAPGTNGTTRFAIDIVTTGLSGTATLLNTAAITTPLDDPVPGDNMSTVGIGLVNEADLAVDITVDQTMPIVGEESVFTLSATNNGPEPATGVQILDNIHTLTELSITGAVASAGTYMSGSGTWSLPSLGVGATETVTVTVTAQATGEPVATLAVSALDQTDPISGNDTDSVPLQVKLADYGDAPDPVDATAGEYPTLLANDGARHAQPIGGATLFLGSVVDTETDGQPDATATGDDTDALGDDEDGVAFTTLVQGVAVTVDVEATAAGLLDAWIDFDADGVFDPAEKIFDAEPVGSGTQSLTSVATVPLTAAADTFARFRLSTDGVALPTGRADDGEVEDYAVTITGQPMLTVDDPSVEEGDPGDDRELVFTVSRSNNASEVMVDVATSDGTATAGSDYTAVPTTTLTFSAGGALTQEVRVAIIEDNTIEPDETVFLDLTSPVGGMIADGQGEGTIVNDDFDATPPTVAAIGVVGRGEIGACSTVLGDVSQLTVRFSEPMANADDPSQYRVLAAGADADLDTLSCTAPAGDDRLVAVLAAVSDDDPATPTVTLDLAGAPRSSGAHRLVVCGTLTDEAGNGLDGGAGAGSDLARTFRVDRFTDVINAHFDDCDPADVMPVVADGWMLSPAMVVAPSREDGDGASISGSLRADLADESLASATQIAPAVGGQRYALRSRFRLQLDAGAGVVFAQGCQFFDQPGGVGLALEAVLDQVELSQSTVGWEARETLFEAPANAQSVACAWSARGRADGATPPMFEIFLDDLLLGVEISSDGFESGDTSGWSDAVPGGAP